jgi:hypothetical protein
MIARVYAAINAVTAAFAREGIAKERFNSEGDYAYRSIDDVMLRLAPLLAEHKLCVLPRVLERSVSERQGTGGELLLAVSVHVAYDIVAVEDGSTHTIEAYGEALDASDKGTAKAMQSAYKYAMLQAFAVPVTGSEDADARSPQLKAPELPAEPVQGWQQWCEDIAEMIRVCESSEAIDRVQSSHRITLAALQRERAELYAQVGQAIGRRRMELAGGAREPVSGHKNGAAKAASGSGGAATQPPRGGVKSKPTPKAQSGRRGPAPVSPQPTAAPAAAELPEVVHA